MSFLLNSQCWCQAHVQHLSLYFSLFKKPLSRRLPPTYGTKLHFTFLLYLHPFSSPSLSLASKVHRMSPNSFVSLFLYIYLHFLKCAHSTLPSRVLKFVFSRKLLRYNLSRCTHHTKGVDDTQRGRRACQGCTKPYKCLLRNSH